MKRFLKILLAIIFFIFMLAGCSNDDDTDGNNNTTLPTIDEFRCVLQRQLEYADILETLLQDMDTTQAKDSVVKIMGDDTLIEWVEIIPDGLNIEWKIMRGSIITSFRNRFGGIKNQKPNALQRKIETNFTSTIKPHPSSLKTIFISPTYSEFRELHDQVISCANPNLSSMRYDTFIVRKNNECTLALLASLADSGYGIIRIASHGFPWPRITDIDEVYLLTGEIANLQTMNTSLGFFPAQELVRREIDIITYQDTNYFSISPSYFVSHQSFSKSPLFLLSFCYSGLGNWFEQLSAHGAIAVVGYDWSIFGEKDMEWMCGFFETMSNTTTNQPTTISQWYSSITTSYYDSLYARNVHILYTGNPDMVLWQNSAYCIIGVGNIEMTLNWSSSSGGGTMVETHSVFFADSGRFVENRFVGTSNRIDGDLVITTTIEIEFDQVTWNIIWLSAQQVAVGTGGIETHLIEASNIPIRNNLPSMLSCEIESTQTCSHISRLRFDYESSDYSSWVTSFSCGDNSNISVFITGER